VAKRDSAQEVNMFRFKLGVVVGFGLGWLVVSGRASELIDRFRASRTAGQQPATADAAGVYDFAVHAAQ
jgi:hypothetical protein